MIGYHRTPADRVAQAQRRLRRGMSFRVHFLLVDLENAVHSLRDVERRRDQALPCTELFVSADDWCRYYRGQVSRIRREIKIARAK